MITHHDARGLTEFSLRDLQSPRETATRVVLERYPLQGSFGWVQG